MYPQGGMQFSTCRWRASLTLTSQSDTASRFTLFLLATTVLDLWSPARAVRTLSTSLSSTFRCSRRRGQDCGATTVASRCSSDWDKLFADSTLQMDKVKSKNHNDPYEALQVQQAVAEAKCKYLEDRRKEIHLTFCNRLAQ